MTLEGLSADVLSVLSRRAERAEVYTYEGESTMITFEANEMKSAEVEESRGIALRCLAGGRLGFTAATGRVPLEQLVDNVLISAEYGDRVPLVFPTATAVADLPTYDTVLEQVPLARLVEIGREIVARIRAADGDAKVGVDIERSTGRSWLCNSVGASTAEQTSELQIRIGVERVRGDDVLMLDDMVSDVALTDAYQEATERVCHRLELARHSASIAPGRQLVLFSPAGAMVLLLPLLLAANGKNVQRGISPLSEKIGQQVFDAQVSLWDDPTLPGRPESGRYDDEGVPCRRKALVRAGVCQGFFSDLKTAALLGGESTGNGRRGPFSAPVPRAANLVLEQGQAPLADVLAGIDAGLLVEDVLGLGQGNTISGAFSNTVGLAYAIRNGEVVGRVKDVSIAGNIYQDLSRIIATTRERYWVYGHILAPYILLPDVNVVSQESANSN